MHHELARRRVYVCEEGVPAKLRGPDPVAALESGGLAPVVGVAPNDPRLLAAVREALVELKALGLVDIVPNRGAYVARPTMEEMRDVYAALGSASGGDVQLQVTQDGAAWAQITIPAGETIASVDGESLAVLRATATLGLDIVSVTSDATLLPGSDLTLVIRL